MLREETERPELTEQGVVILVRSRFERIVEETQRLHDDETAYSKWLEAYRLTEMVKQRKGSLAPYGNIPRD